MEAEPFVRNDLREKRKHKNEKRKQIGVHQFLKMFLKSLEEVTNTTSSNFKTWLMNSVKNFPKEKRDKNVLLIFWELLLHI